MFPPSSAFDFSPHPETKSRTRPSAAKASQSSYTSSRSRTKRCTVMWRRAVAMDPTGKKRGKSRKRRTGMEKGGIHVDANIEKSKEIECKGKRVSFLLIPGVLQFSPLSSILDDDHFRVFHQTKGDRDTPLPAALIADDDDDDDIVGTECSRGSIYGEKGGNSLKPPISTEAWSPTPHSPHSSAVTSSTTDTGAGGAAVVALVSPDDDERMTTIQSDDQTCVRQLTFPANNCGPTMKEWEGAKSAQKPKMLDSRSGSISRRVDSPSVGGDEVHHQIEAVSVLPTLKANYKTEYDDDDDTEEQCDYEIGSSSHDDDGGDECARISRSTTPPITFLCNSGGGPCSSLQTSSDSRGGGGGHQHQQKQQQQQGEEEEGSEGGGSFSSEQEFKQCPHSCDDWKEDEEQQFQRINDGPGDEISKSDCGGNYPSVANPQFVSPPSSCVATTEDDPTTRSLALPGGGSTLMVLRHPSKTEEQIDRSCRRFYGGAAVPVCSLQFS